jgi:hypothetical protein
VADQPDRLGSSGVFKAIVDTARKFKRAVTGGDEVELSPEAHELGQKIAQAIVANRFGDVHAMSTRAVQQRTPRDVFDARWRDAVKERVPFTGFAISDAGEIDLAYIPGLEDTPQEQFVAFLEIAFSTASVPLDDKAAFTVAAVLLDDDGVLRLGALHTH